MNDAELEAVSIYFKLTERQREVIRLMLNGVTNYKRMAKLMKVAPTTVRTHCDAAEEITKTTDRVALVVFVLRRPLLERFILHGAPDAGQTKG